MITILADQGADCPAYHLCWQDYLQTQFSPAHLLSELGFTIVFDLILIFLIWGKIIKPYINRRLNKLHTEMDAEHNIVHHDDHVHHVQARAQHDNANGVRQDVDLTQEE